MAAPGEVVRRGGRGGRQPGRPAAAPGPLPAARRASPTCPGWSAAGGSRRWATGVEGWAVGDEVCALLAGGGYAEQVAVPAGQLLPVPDGVGLVEAAALPEVACTVWSQRVHAGRAAARARRCSCTAGRAASAPWRSSWPARVGRAGGRHRGQPRPSSTPAASSARTSWSTTGSRTSSRRSGRRPDGAGADVVLDNMGAEYLARNLDVLATNGRLVVIGMQGGTKAELDLGTLMAQARRGARDLAAGAAARRRRPRSSRGVREHVWPLSAPARCARWCDATFPLERRRRGAPA